MNIAYFGSPEISAAMLDHLITDTSHGHNISLVITQPDRPVGKHLEIQPTAVKKIAQAHSIPFFDKTPSPGQNELVELLHKHNIELCILFAYREIIKNELLNTPKYGFWNIHPSLLPLYRGPSPIVYAILNGDAMTGVSLIQLNSRMDAGPIIAQIKTPLEPQELRNELESRLTLVGTSLLIQTLKKLNENKKIELKPQDDSSATYTHLLKKSHGFVTLSAIKKACNNRVWTKEDCPDLLKSYIISYQKDYETSFLQNSATALFNYYRALTPWPGIWTLIQTSQGVKRLQINDIEIQNNLLSIKTVTLEGRKRIKFTEFNKSYNVLSL